MTDRLIALVQSALFATGVGILGALLLAHWAACDALMC